MEGIVKMNEKCDVVLFDLEDYYEVFWVKLDVFVD